MIRMATRIASCARIMTTAPNRDDRQRRASCQSVFLRPEGLATYITCRKSGAGTCGLVLSHSGKACVKPAADLNDPAQGFVKGAQFRKSGPQQQPFGSVM